ncbi:MAG: hypothetical protein HFG69_07325 [Hungatella sp.]|nr:hypothetical protein [Hungatella sp.]
MNKIKVSIWGREFELYISYQNFPGEEVTQNQELTYGRISIVEFDESLDAVKQYVMKNDGSEVDGDSIDNIFKYVMPKSILITRDEDVRVFAIMCNYKFDMEHGIAVVYQDEKYKAVGPQDLIL